MRTLVLTLSLCLLSAAVHAKPVFIDLETLFAEAILAAEVEVVRVVEPQQQGRGVQTPGTITLKISRDPRRIIIGHEYIGKTVEFEPAARGPVGCCNAFEKARAAGTKVIVVVDGSKKVSLYGTVTDGEKGRIWTLNGFCDFNACILYAKNPAFGVAAGNRDIIRTAEVAESFLAEHCVSRGGRVVIEAARSILGLTQPLPAEKLQAIIAKLSAPHFDVREAAQQELIRTATASIPALKAELEKSADPEIRGRLAEVLQNVAVFETATALAATTKKEGSDAECRLIARAFPALDADGQRAAGERLRAAEKGGAATDPAALADGWLVEARGASK